MPPTITVSTRRGRRARELRSPFVAAAMCEALCAVSELGVSEARSGVARLTEYLQNQREGDGSWCFEPHERRWPPDADSTACALAALARAGEPAAASILRRIVGDQSSPEGLLRPWLLWHPGAEERLDGNVADAIVTANVLFASHRAGENGTDVLRALEDHVASRGLAGLATVYYDSLPVRAYYLARAVVPLSSDGPVARALRAFISELDPRKLNVVDAAAVLAAAAFLGVASGVSGLLPGLLAAGEPGGTWPEERWFVDPADKIWRSAAFSTALAVEALTLFAGGEHA